MEEEKLYFVPFIGQLDISFTPDPYNCFVRLSI